MEASKRFLVSYFDSLIGLKLDLSDDPRKVMSIVLYDVHVLIHMCNRQLAPCLGHLQVKGR